jgi:outer membrane protein assembly factor BamB
VVTSIGLRPAAIAEGRAYVTTEGHWDTPNPIVAYDLETGVELWSYDFGHDVTSVGEPTYSEGRVYLGQNKGTETTTNLWAFEAATGRLVFRVGFDSQW